MAKKNLTEADDFVSSFGVPAAVPGPVETGDAHAGRPADQEGESDPTRTTYEGDPAAQPLPPRTVMLSRVFDSLYALPDVELQGMYGELQKLGGFGGDSHALRPADVNTKDQSPASYVGADLSATQTVSEDLKLILKDSNLSEAVIAEAVTLFQAALHNKLLEVRAQLEDRYAGALQESVDEFSKTLEERNEQYMDALAEEWLKENEVAVESNVRVALAESFIDGLKKLFEDHYVDMPAERVNVEAELMNKVDELQEALDAANAKLLESTKPADTKPLTESLEETDQDELRATVLASLSESLTEPQKARFAAITEDVQFTDEASFRSLAEKLIPLVTAPVHPVKKLALLESLEAPVNLSEDQLNSNKPTATPENVLIKESLAQLSRMSSH